MDPGSKPGKVKPEPHITLHQRFIVHTSKQRVTFTTLKIINKCLLDDIMDNVLMKCVRTQKGPKVFYLWTPLISKSWNIVIMPRFL